MSEKPDLVALVAKWLPRLRLGNWKVTIQYLRVYDMPENTSGQVRSTETRLEAHINVLDPNDYDPACASPLDVEATVVHELVHLYFIGSAISGDDKREELILEQAVQRIATALVSLDRGEATESVAAPLLYVQSEKAGLN